MKAPSGFDSAALTLWRRVVSDLEQREVLRDVDASAIERYVRAEMIARQAWARLAKREKQIGPDAWRARATHGGVTVDPDYKIASEAMKAAQSFAHDLGITPRARAAVRAPTDDLDSMLAELTSERR